VPNLFVTDGACMTSSGNQNPSITYMALTARACDHAVEQLKRRDLLVPDRVSRRRFLRVSTTSMAALSAAAGAFARADERAPEALPAAGRLKQSVCRWTLPGPLPGVCQRIKVLGLARIDLLYPDEWQVARASGLTCSMGYASRRDHLIENGFNDPQQHAPLSRNSTQAIPRAAQAGVPNLIAMFGNRRGRSDADGICELRGGPVKGCAGRGCARRHGVRGAPEQQSGSPRLSGRSTLHLARR